MAEPVPDVTFDEFCSTNWPTLVRAMWLICGDAERSEEVVQEAFVRALRRWKRVSRLESPVGWVRHVALNQLRSAWRRDRVFERRKHLAAAHSWSEFDEGVVLRLALDGLSRDDRAIVVARYYLDLPTAQIASDFGLSEVATRARISRALRRLGALLASDESDGLEVVARSTKGKR